MINRPNVEVSVCYNHYYNIYRKDPRFSGSQVYTISGNQDQTAQGL